MGLVSSLNCRWSSRLLSLRMKTIVAEMSKYQEQCLDLFVVIEKTTFLSWRNDVSRSETEMQHLSPPAPSLTPRWCYRILRNIALKFYLFASRNLLIKLAFNIWTSQNSRHQKMDKKLGFQCLRHSNWNICRNISQFCSLNFPTSTSLFWWVQFLLPQKEAGWKRENGFLPTWVKHGGLSA